VITRPLNLNLFYRLLACLVLIDEVYRSAITLFQFDCQDKKSQKLNSYGHEEAMGKGRQIDLLEKNPPWIELPPNSIGLHLIEAYCLGPKASLKHP